LAGSGRIKVVKYWAIKIFIITLIISAGVSIVSEVFIKNLPIYSAIAVLLLLIFVGILFDIIGVAFASCDETPFISMSAKKIKKANRAIKLLKNAEMVSNICNDVVGDICGIVSGTAGAAITLMLIVGQPDTSQTLTGILVASLTAALTVSGKALGKKIAMRNNRKIVEYTAAFIAFFEFDKKKKRDK